jgi:sialic acid synthase SpsE
VEDIKKGQKFNKQNIRVIRPGYGINPLYYFKLINKESPLNFKKYEPLKKNLLKKVGIKFKI